MSEAGAVISAFIASLLSIVPAVVAPILSEKITQRGQRKHKTMEQLFDARSDAYKSLMKATFSCPENPNPQAVAELIEAQLVAIMYSTEETTSKICEMVKNALNLMVHFRQRTHSTKPLLRLFGLCNASFMAKGKRRRTRVALLATLLSTADLYGQKSSLM